MREPVVSEALGSRRGQMDPPRETGPDAGLKVLIRHLVLSFPQAAILSRSVGERYHVCVIVPYDGSPEKAAQVERALCDESARSIKGFELLLSQLNLPLLFQTRDRYDVRVAHPPPFEPDGEPDRSPANEGWPAAPIGGTVFHGPFDLSGSFLSTPPGAGFALPAD